MAHTHQIKWAIRREANLRLARTRNDMDDDEEVLKDRMKIGVYRRGVDLHIKTAHESLGV